MKHLYLLAHVRFRSLLIDDWNNKQKKYIHTHSLLSEVVLRRALNLIHSFTADYIPATKSMFQLWQKMIWYDMCALCCKMDTENIFASAKEYLIDDKNVCTSSVSRAVILLYLYECIWVWVHFFRMEYKILYVLPNTVFI